MLIGQYTSKLTDKDRISVPKRVRLELGKEMIVAKWYEHCLVLVSKETWDDLLKRLVGEPGLIISAVRDIYRFILGSAFEVKLDRQGRFILPKVLLGYASVKAEVVFVGLGDRVEIWAIEKWNELEKTIEERAWKAIEKIAQKRYGEGT
jgi:MraZ protein